jgi:hypothetical protein
MDIQMALLVILTLCIIINAGVVVVLILLVRKWKRLIKIVEEKVLNK